MTTTHAITVDPANAEALRAWDGDDGAYWAEHEDTFDRSLDRYRAPFLDVAAVGPADRVLDIGCGNGQTTRLAATLARDGAALGVDLSSRMLDRARARAAAEGIANVRFLQADAQIHPFDPGAFDVAISRTGVMFFADPAAAFANIVRALHPRGRLALVVWRSIAENEWIRDLLGAASGGRDLPSPPPDAPGPFSFADPDRLRGILEAGGFADVELDAADEPMWFGATAEHAFRFVRGLGVVAFLLRGLEHPERARALDGLRATIDAHATGDGVLYPSAVWIVRARRP
jgi:SAM-dependent methyltransferase